MSYEGCEMKIANLEDELEVSEKENKKLKDILVKAAKKTHKCKELYDWYCINEKELKNNKKEEKNGI